jgi:hypothetical protein
MPAWETDFLRSLISFFLGAAPAPLPPPDMDWGRFETTAENNGLLPMVVSILERTPAASIPGHFLVRWKNIRRKVLTLNLAYQAELNRLSRRYPGPDLAIIKGAALLSSVYADISLRPQSDADILVRRENQASLAEALAALNFTPNSYYPTRWEKGPLVIDVHYDLLDLHRIKTRAFISAMPVDYSQGLLLVPVPRSGRLLMLSPPDTLLYSCLHYAKHSFSQWIWLVDAALLIRTYNSPLFRENLRHRAQDLGLGKPLQFMLETLFLTFRIDYRALHPDPKPFSGMEKMIRDGVVKSRPLPQAGEILFFFMIKGWGRRFRFALEIALLRPAVLKEVFSFRSNLLLPVFYPLRILQAARFLLGFLAKTNFRAGRPVTSAYPR